MKQPDWTESSHIIRDSIQKIALHGLQFPLFMTRISAFFQPKRLFRVLTVAVTAASLPAYGQAPATAKRNKTDDRDAPTTLEAEQVSGRPDREIVLDKDVEITRGETIVNADHATYRVVEDEVEAKGNVRMLRFGDEYTG